MWERRDFSFKNITGLAGVYTYGCSGGVHTKYGLSDCLLSRQIINSSVLDEEHRDIPRKCTTLLRMNNKYVHTNAAKDCLSPFFSC